MYLAMQLLISWKLKQKPYSSDSSKWQTRRGRGAAPALCSLDLSLKNREGNNVDNKGVSTVQKEMPYKVAVLKQEDIL